MARWQKGESGNRQGRPKGVPNPQARLREAIGEHVPEIIAMLVHQAKGGDVGAARLLLERVLPPMKATEPPQAFTMPDGTLSEQARAVVASVASGELAVGAGSQLLGGLAQLARIVESDELTKRIEALEAHKNGINP